MSVGSGVSSVRKCVRRTQPSAWHRGRAHQWWPLSRRLLPGTLREAELGEQRKGLYRGGGASLGTGSESPRPWAGSVLVHFIFQGGIHPCSLGTARGPSRDGAPSGFSHAPPWLAGSHQGLIDIFNPLLPKHSSPNTWGTGAGEVRTACAGVTCACPQLRSGTHGRL